MNEAVFLLYFSVVAVAAALLTWAVMSYGTKKRTERELAEAQRIVARAEAKAAAIARRTEHFASELSEERLKEMFTEHTRGTDKVARNIEQAAGQQINQVGKRLREHVEQLEDKLAQVAKVEQQKLQQELARNKKQKMAALETKVKALLPKIVEEVVGQAIPLAEHERLVKEALQKTFEGKDEKTYVSKKEAT